MLSFSCLGPHTAERVSKHLHEDALRVLLSGVGFDQLTLSSLCQPAMPQCRISISLICQAACCCCQSGPQAAGGLGFKHGDVREAELQNLMLEPTPPVRLLSRRMAAVPDCCILQFAALHRWHCWRAAWRRGIAEHCNFVLLQLRTHLRYRHSGPFWYYRWATRLEHEVVVLSIKHHGAESDALQALHWKWQAKQHA